MVAGLAGGSVKMHPREDEREFRDPILQERRGSGCGFCVVVRSKLEIFGCRAACSWTVPWASKLALLQRR
jgi:hypothetical protein